ncbi:MAG TPA: hypothetical protein VGX91_01040 [Candidatus Cybelea sp.]|jgi:hypothetical protein|nr:hypothetical protein [Candidatus Cybelea sp.]
MTISPPLAVEMAGKQCGRVSNGRMLHGQDLWISFEPQLLAVP